MRPFAIEWRDVGIALAVFVGVIAVFAILSQLTGWPHKDSGWPTVVILALVLAFLPAAARTLDFFAQSRATIEAPFGVKINFAAAVVSEARAMVLPDNILQQGQSLNESSLEELDRATREATAQSVVVIDLGDGRAWYETRLFAAAATAAELGAPRIMVLVGQCSGRPQQMGGWIRPADLVKGLVQRDHAYARVRRHALRYLHAFKSGAAPADLPKLSWYQHGFEQEGDIVLTRILVGEMRNPDPTLALTPLESASQPRWTSLAELERQLAAWLVCDRVDLLKPGTGQLSAVLSADQEILLAASNGQFAGVIDVGRVERQVLRQLVERASGA